jgi:outer membrane protein
MKNNLILLVTCALIGLSTSLSAQTHLKIGYTDPNYVMELMPETKQISVELAAYEKQLQGQLQSKYAEYQTKLEAYQQGSGTMAPLVKQDKEKDLLAMQSSIKEFEEKAQEDLQRKQMSLLDPVLTKIQKAIDAVADEHGYTYIFSSAGGGAQGVILYAKNKNENISDLVLKKLGVTPPAPGTTTPPTNNTTAPIKK